MRISFTTVCPSQLDLYANQNRSRLSMSNMPNWNRVIIINPFIKLWPIYWSTDILIRKGRKGDIMASSTASTAARYKVFLYGLVKENIRRNNLKSKPFFGEPEAIKTNPKSLKGLRWSNHFPAFNYTIMHHFSYKK